MPHRSDLPQGTLDLLILHVVAAGAIHGYGIAQRLQQVSRDVVQVPQGSLYPALHRLENRGLLTADWKMSDTGREAKFYRLTPKGRRQLKEEEASWLRLTEAIVAHRGVCLPERSDLPQGTLDLLILHVVAAGAIHGYGIAQRLQQVSRDVVQVPQGSLYPALHRLENRGLLTADWKMSDTCREAKFYRLTSKGRRQLKEEAASWLRLTEAIGLILKTAGGPR